MYRRIVVYKDYFVNFYKSQDHKIQEKIEYVLDLVRFEKQVPVKFLKTPAKEIKLAEKLKNDYLIEKYGRL